MKKSEKIGIVIVAILAIILASVLLSARGNNKTSKQDFCAGLCQPSGTETWFLIGEPRGGNNDNNFSTKNECINDCLLKK